MLENKVLKCPSAHGINAKLFIVNQWEHCLGKLTCGNKPFFLFLCTEFICFPEIQFSVPFEPARRQKWIDAIETHQQFDYYVSRYFVCEQHFSVDAIKRIGFRTDLKPNAIPTIFPQMYVNFA